MMLRKGSEKREREIERNMKERRDRHTRGDADSRRADVEDSTI
jgi:hypothetical protein